MSGLRSAAWFPTPRRPNPVFSEEYRQLVGVLIELRTSAGITQRELARRLGKVPSHISMIERGQRRVDALELYLISRSLGLEPAAVFQAMVDRIETLSPAERADGPVQSAA